MRPQVIVMGASLGALDAMYELLPWLKPDFPATLVIVMHRDKKETGNLILLLDAVCDLPIGCPLDKERLEPGYVYIAPPNYHLLVEGDHFAYSVDEPDDFARPSINILFESAAQSYGADVTGIVLTGMRTDGARGLAAIRLRGGSVIVQSPEEAYAPAMPAAALKSVPDAQVKTLREIGEWLSGLGEDRPMNLGKS